MHHITSKWRNIGQCIGLSLLEPVLHGFEVHASADLLSCAVHVNNHTEICSTFSQGSFQDMQLLIVTYGFFP